MNEVFILYEIVPIGDGSHYMCKNENGEYYREHKACNSKDQLVFSSKHMAQKYIDKYLNADHYVPEQFGYNIDYLLCKIITEV
jgi:hypothetical protein